MIRGLWKLTWVEIKIFLNLPPGTVVDTYWKYGPTPDDPTPHWYEFLFDGTTGAVIDGNVITLHFVDGQRGDDDLTANGVIVDPGAPALGPGPNIRPLLLQSICGIPACGVGAMATVPVTCIGLLGMKMGLRRRRNRSRSQRCR